MGFLETGTPLPWNDSLSVIKYVREHGVQQFLTIWRRMRNLKGDVLMWGDEVEYHIVAFDHEEKRVRVSLQYGSWMVEATPRTAYGGYTSDLIAVERNMRNRRNRLIKVLRPNESAISTVAFPLLGVGDFTVPKAQVPGQYSKSAYVPDECINPHPRFKTLTQNIRMRRGSRVNITAPVFRDTNTPPSDRQVHMDCMAFGMGCCCLQVTFQCCDIQESRHLYDALAVFAPVMLALTAACPIMRGKLLNTDARWRYIAASVDDRTPEESGIYAVQLNGTKSKKEMAGFGEKRLYKSRYDSISHFICNHKAGKDIHSCIECYNDVPVAIDEDVKEELKRGGVDDVLAAHIAHLFVRDPLVVFKERVELDDERDSDHCMFFFFFPNIFFSTNWQTVRWKPPPAKRKKTKNNSEDEENTNSQKKHHHIGWRTEFRPMEAQITDFENAAFTVFVVLVSRVILAFDLNMYIPISKIDESLKRAHVKNFGIKKCAIHSDHVRFIFFIFYFLFFGKKKKKIEFFFRTKFYFFFKYFSKIHDGSIEMTALEILIGKGNFFPGFVPLIHAYLDTIKCDSVCYIFFNFEFNFFFSYEILLTVNKYLEFIVMRATGELLTNAAWMRKFVSEHPKYKKDSTINEVVAYDLLYSIKSISEGTLHVCFIFFFYKKIDFFFFFIVNFVPNNFFFFLVKKNLKYVSKIHCPEILGKDHKIKPFNADEAYEIPLSSSKGIVGPDLCTMVDRCMFFNKNLKKNHFIRNFVPNIFFFFKYFFTIQTNQDPDDL
eukprot:GSMAST32.ASY1.ANO1.342.1 assembled CDS